MILIAEMNVYLPIGWFWASKYIVYVYNLRTKTDLLVVFVWVKSQLIHSWVTGKDINGGKYGSIYF